MDNPGFQTYFRQQEDEGLNPKTAHDGGGLNGNFNGVPTNQDTSSAWAKCAKNLWDHDEAAVKGWKEEIDTLLVFVGTYLDANDSL